jgi:hypothetical protein
MPIHTFVENGELVGFLPNTPFVTRVPLREIMAGARANFSAAELAELDGMSGDTVGGVVDDVVGGKIARKLKKVIKKVAKSKVMKGIVSMVKKAVPPPFNVAVKAAEGAAKFAGALKGKKKSPAAKKAQAKAKKLVPAVRAAAAGRISPKALTRAAKKAGVKPSIAVDAAVMKRVATDARTNPKARATLRLSRDLTSTVPAEQARAAEAIEDSNYAEPTTSRDDGQGYDSSPQSMSTSDDGMTPTEQEAMTEDPYGPDEVQPFEMDEGEADGVDETDGAMDESEAVEGYGYY